MTKYIFTFPLASESEERGVVSRNTLGRGTRAPGLHSFLLRVLGGARRGALGATLVAFVGLAVAVLVACPATPSPGPTGPSSNCEVGEGVDQIIGSDVTSDDDTLRGTAANELLDGLAGNDTLYGGGGADIFCFSGSFGMDSIGTDSSSDTHLESSDQLYFTASAAFSYSYSGTDITIGQGSHSLTVYDANRTSGEETVGGRIESLADFGLRQGSSNWQVIVGTAARDITGISNRTLLGGMSADIIWGLDGEDNIVGREGADILLGGADSDTILGSEDDDLLIGGPGSDILYGGGNLSEASLGGSADNAQGSDTFVFGSNFGNDGIGSAGFLDSYGIDAADTLEFTDTGALTLSWGAPDSGGDQVLTITQGSDTVTVAGANEALSGAGFAIEWNGITERVDSTTDLMVDGS